MHLGMHLRELLRMRVGVALSLLVAALVALSVTYRVSFFPPALQPRAVEMAAATTHVLVDTSKSLLLDTRYGAGDFDAMTERAVLLGNIMASLPVREYIARRAHVPAGAIRASTPLTPDYPRPAAVDGRAGSPADLLRPVAQYRLSIQANPTVPILDVYAQAPTPRAAEELADGAVGGLQDYLAAARSRGAVHPASTMRLTQLGRADGRTVNGGVRLQMLLVSFGLAFALCCVVTFAFGRVRAGWRAAQRLERVTA